MVEKDTGWWKDFYADFRPLFDIIPKKVSNAEARYIIKKLGLKPGKSFLDCPCGIGRIAIPMARKGIRVMGVDITPSFLDELAEKAKKLNLKVDIIRRDMRQIDFNSRFDAAGNVWTSFGYFEEDSDNMLVLQKMYCALKPGGKFILHVINRDWIMANYTPRDWHEFKDPKRPVTVRVLEKRHFDYSKSINYGTWHWISDGKEKTYKVSIRMYSYHELLRMFTAVGFTDIEGYGSIKDEPIARDKQMMFVIGTKPKRGYHV